MPDTLASFAEPVEPTTKAPSASMPAVPFNPNDVVARLYRERKEAERICNETRGEGDNGPTMQAYFRAHDRFIDAPVSSLADVLLKIEVMVESEDFEATLEEEPKHAYPKVFLDLLRDLRASPVEAPAYMSPTAAPPTLDVLAIHRDADRAVNRLYDRQALLGDGLAVMHEVFQEGLGTHPRGAEVNFMIKAIKEIADNIIDVADDITNAIDPLNPTVLDEQVA